MVVTPAATCQFVAIYCTKTRQTLNTLSWSMDVENTPGYVLLATLTSRHGTLSIMIDQPSRSHISVLPPVVQSSWEHLVVRHSGCSLRGNICSVS